MKNPLVSVVIPIYNHGKYIEEAVMSVLTQDFGDLELIVVNDGSTDNTEEVVKMLASRDSRVIYIYQEKQDAYVAINTGIRMAKGEYISILNADDVYKGNKLSETLKVFEEDQSVQAVFSDFDIVYTDGSFVKLKGGAHDNWVGFSEETSFKGSQSILLNLLSGNFFGTTSNLVCRKTVFDEVGYFLNYRYAHDLDFFLKVCYNCEVRFINKSLFKYRMHDSNTVNENRAALNMDVGLILTDFLLNANMALMVGKESLDFDDMIKFFKSVNMFNTERVVMFLLLFCMNNGGRKLIDELRNDSNHPLRKVMINYLSDHLPPNTNVPVARTVDISTDFQEKVYEGRPHGGVNDSNSAFLKNLKKLFPGRAKS